MSRTNSTSLHRRDFLRASAAAAALWTIVPRHVLGGPKFVAPSDKVNVAVVGVGGQGRTKFASLFQESDAQIIAVADPIAESNLDAFYYKGLGGREPVKAEVEKHFAAADAQLQVRRLRGLSGDAGEGKGDRRRPLRHARPSARLCLRGGDAGRQARVLRETADAQPRGRPAPWLAWPKRPAWPRNWATKAIRGTGFGRPANGFGTARSARSARSMPGSARAAGTRPSPASRPTRRPCQRESTGTCGWDRATRGPTTRLTHR